MAGDALLQYRVKFSVDDNLDKVLERAKRIQSELGTERGQAGQFGAGIQAASERAREVAKPSLELANALRSLDQIRKEVLRAQGDGVVGYQREMRAGGLKQGSLNPPPYRVGEGLRSDREISLDGDSKANLQALRLKMAMAQQASLQGVLAADDTYTGLQKRIAAAKGTQQARLLELQNADDAYTTIQKRIAAAKGTQQSKLLDAQNADDNYAKIQRDIAQGKATQKAKLLDQQNADDSYAKTQKAIAQGKATQQAKLLDLQNADDNYAKAQKSIAQGKAVQQGKLLDQQNADDNYAKAQKKIADGKATQQIKLLDQQNSDDEYAKKQKQISQGKATQQAKLLEQQNADDSYAKTQKAIAQGKLEQKAKLLEQQNADDSYAKSQKAIAQGKKKQEADILRQQNSDPEYQEITKELTRQREEQKALAEESKAADPEYLAFTKRAALAREEVAASTQASLAGDPAYAAATAKTKAARERQAAAAQEVLLGDAKYITATARANKAREEIAAKVALEQAGISSKGMNRQELLANAALAKRTEADLQAAAAARVALRGNEQSYKAAIDKQVAEAALARELRVREKAELKARIQSGEAGGTRFQQLQSLLSPTAKAPDLFPTIGQMAGQKTITTAGYAVGGALVGAAMFGTIEAVKEASKLQELFAGLKGQMDTIGQSGSFGQVRDGIKSISNETGIAASEVTKFAARLLGVFNDPTRALKETEAAMKLAVVSGTDLGTMIEELVPVAEQFGTSIEHIGDLAVYIHDKFGIAEESTLHFLGEIAPLAEEAGLSIEEMGVIGATAANSIGKSINVAAEQFSKVLPTMQQNQDKIFQILRSNPDTEGLVDPIVEAFGRGESGEALKYILGAYGQLDQVQQQNLIRVSGSRREWALLNGLFSNSSKLLLDMSTAEDAAGRNTGGLDRRFQQVSATLSRNMERIQESFKNAIESVLASGIGDALAVVGKGVESILGLINLVLGAFYKLNEALKLPGTDIAILAPMVQFALATAIATKAFSVFNNLRKGGTATSVLLSRGEDGLTASITRRTSASQAGTTVMQGDTTSKEANAVATGEAAAAEEGLATSRTAGGLTGLRYNSGLGRFQNAQGKIVSNEAAKGAITWNDKLGRYTAGGRIVSNEAGAAAGMFSHLPAPPAGGLSSQYAGLFANQFQNSPLLTRAFAGGSYLKFGGADTAAAAQGIKSGPGALFGVGAAVFAGMQVKQTRDEQSEELNKQANDLREQFKGKSDTELASISKDFDGFWDDVQQGLFSVDLPGRLAQKEQARRIGQRGAAGIGVVQSRNEISKFADSFSDRRIGEINDYLNSTDETFRYAQEIGADTQQNVAEKVASGLGQLSHLPNAGNFGKGQINVSKENLKKLLPEIKRRAEAGEAGAAQLAKYVEDEITNNSSMSEIKRAMSEAVGKGNVKEAIDKAGGIEQFLQIQGLYDPKGQYQTGQISRGAYIGLVRQKVSDLKKQLKGAPDVEKAQKEFDAALKEAQDLQDQINLERVELLKVTAPMTEFKPKTAIYTGLLQALPTLSIPKQMEKVPELIQGKWDAYQEQLNFAQSPEAWRQQALGGIEVDPEVRVLSMMRAATDSDAVAGLLERGKGWTEPLPPLPPLPKNATPEDWKKRNAEVEARADEIADRQQTADQFNKEVAELAEREGISYKEAFLRIARDREAKQKAANPNAISPYTDLIKEAEASTSLEGVQGVADQLLPPPELVEKQFIDLQSQARKAAITLRASQSGTSPYVAAQAQLDTARAELDRLLAQKGTTAAGPTIDADIAVAQAAVNSALVNSQSVVDQTAAAMDNWAVVMANGDPVKETAARLDAANNALVRLLAENHGDERDPRVIQARQQIQQLHFQEIDNANNIIKAQMATAAFERNRDPEKAAEDALKAANFSLATAKGEAEAEAARLQIKQAIRSAHDAEEEWLQTMAQSDITQANIRQDPVGAAQRAVQEAQRRIDAAKAAGAGRSEIKRLTDDLAQKRSDALDTAVQNQMSLIDYMLEMSEITVGQAIERLKTERDKYEVNSIKWREIQLKINSLQKQSQQDAQYNLPANITLPTLYEARRLNQSRAMGIGYLDSRNISLTFNVNGTQDAEAVTNQIVGAMQASLGGGQMFSPGMSVGAMNN